MGATSDQSRFAVVAVDGSEEGYAAVEFAAHEALRRGLALRLAHVMPAYRPVGPLLAGTDHSIGAYASETLASAARVAAEAAPELDVTAQALRGGRVSQVLEHAGHAELIVLGRRSGRALDRAWSGGTLDGIASRAHCPVLVVPRVARPQRPSPRVAMGFKSSAQSAGLFDAAFRVADGLGAELEVLHAWKLASAYDDIIVRRVSEAKVNGDQKRIIWGLLEPWRRAYPHVRVRVRVVHDYPVRALIEASRDADRLVLGKPLHGGVLHHLGRTARGTLRLAQCPIEVVPAQPRDQVSMPTFTIEEKGQLVP